MLPFDYACHTTDNFGHPMGKGRTLVIIKGSKLCDGKPDCPLGDDEQCP